MNRLKGKTAFVTGASRGIGRAIALELAAEGAKVAINYHEHEAAAVEVQKAIISKGGEALHRAGRHCQQYADPRGDPVV